MAENLSQEEIDELIAAYGNKVEMVEVEYQEMICVYCHKKMKWKSLEVYDVFTNMKCRNNPYGHRLVNKGFLLCCKNPKAKRKDIKPDTKLAYVNAT